jgi:ArsR family transcriptional regulator
MGWDKKESIIKTLNSCENIGPNASEHLEFLQNLRNQFQNNAEHKSTIQVLSALGNPDRFFIIELLREKDRCGCEIEAALRKSQPAISRHIHILEDIGLIKGWRHGKFTHYSLIKPTFDKLQNNLNQWINGIQNWLG